MRNIAPISQQIWDMKYRLKTALDQPIDKTIADSWRRVARALAAGEADPELWEDRFFSALEGFKFLPAGRILSGAGAERNVTLFNCFVMGDIPDDMGGIFDSLKEAALTMQQGGGIGYDFSTLRPKGAPVKGVGAKASGPLTFMDVWDSMCRTIMSAGTRRGAMMGVMRCDHPDLPAFIEAKREAGRLRMFNLSVLVTDAFLAAVKADDSWDLIYDGVVFDTVRARDLWDKIMHATYAYAEPGVIFIDRINRLNNLHYCETIHATNPCGEQPLPAYGTCLLGSLNLARLVDKPFTDDAHIDLAALTDLATTALRMLDNVIDVSNYPLDAQRNEAKAKRRIGLGITGLGDALIMCKARYGGKQALALTDRWMAAIRRAAYMASANLAKEKGAFPLFEAEPYLAGEFIQSLDDDVRAAIAQHGIRNSHLISIAPTGTISLLADNVSSGLEPVFSFSYMRNVMMDDGSRRQEEVSDFAYREFKRHMGVTSDGAISLPDYFVDSQGLTPHDHLVMQAKVQEYVDSSISKTINVAEDISFEDFRDIYREAYDLGCKGCTTYRPNDVTGSVLQLKPDDKADAKKTGNANAAQSQAELPLVMPSTAARSKSAVKASAPSSPVIHMFEPLSRPETLPGATYKVRWPETDHAIYMTLNDIIDDNGRRRPFEVFINSKEVEHFAWMVALTRMISAVFRRGGDVSFVVEELKAVFDPRGGHWMGGRYVPSLLAALGEVIEKHMIATGFVADPNAADDEPSYAQQVVNLRGANMGGSVEEGFANNASGGSATVGKDTGTSSAAPLYGATDSAKADARFRRCPKCQQNTLIRQEGCDSCASCGHSKCG